MKKPKTIIFCFGYGGIFQETNMCLIRDCCHAALHYGEASALAGMASVAWERGADLSDMKKEGAWQVDVASPPEDALINRARSNAAAFFIEKTDAEVMIQIDHDLIWRGPDDKYEGDLLHLAMECERVKGVVGACVSKKVKGQGIASMLKNAAECTIPSPVLHPAWYVGAAFTAYHRDVVKAVYDSFKPNDLYRPIFDPLRVPHPLVPGAILPLSEDWAFNHRMRVLGLDRSFLSTMPMVGHIGKYTYKVVGDALPNEDAKKQPSAPTVYMTNATLHDIKMEDGEYPLVKISCVHATRGRPQKAAEARAKWMSLANCPERIEWIFSIDSDDETGGVEKNIDTTVCGESRGNVDAYNRGFRKSTGDIIVQVHDDVVPPKGWDTEICKRLNVVRPEVLRVGDGLGSNVNGSKPWLIPIAIGTRKFFERVGGIFYPEYVSVFCDDDLGMKADKDGTAINCPDLIFQHQWEGPDNDECKQRSYAAENWKLGEALLERRKLAGFPDCTVVQGATVQAGPRSRYANVCMSEGGWPNG